MCDPHCISFINWAKVRIKSFSTELLYSTHLDCNKCINSTRYLFYYLFWECSKNLSITLHLLVPDYFTTGANNFHGRKRRFLNITGQFQIYQRKEFSLDNCNPNTTGLGISKWQLTIYFYLTYEIGVELVIYWMLRLTIYGTICVNFDSINFGNWLKMTFLCKWSGNYSLFYSITRTFDIYQLCIYDNW